MGVICQERPGCSEFRWPHFTGVGCDAGVSGIRDSRGSITGGFVDSDGGQRWAESLVVPG